MVEAETGGGLARGSVVKNGEGEREWGAEREREGGWLLGMVLVVVKYVVKSSIKATIGVDGVTGVTNLISPSHSPMQRPPLPPPAPDPRLPPIRCIHSGSPEIRLARAGCTLQRSCEQRPGMLRWLTS